MDAATPTPQTAVTRNESAGRYELRVDDEVVSIAEYSERSDAIVVPHVETRPDRRNQGFSHRLMAGVVDDVKRRKLKIVPICPAARAYVTALPDADELIAH